MGGAKGSDNGVGINVPFLYTGQGSSNIPRDVTHVWVHSSIKVIKQKAFFLCKQLVDVELSEGLERIRESAFEG